MSFDRQVQEVLRRRFSLDNLILRPLPSATCWAESGVLAEDGSLSGESTASPFRLWLEPVQGIGRSGLVGGSWIEVRTKEWICSIWSQ